MVERRQVLAGLATTAIATHIPRRLVAAASIEPDDTSALLVISLSS